VKEIRTHLNLQYPSSPIASEDVIGCHFDSKGLFSVKSAYKVQIDADSSRLGVSSASSVHHSGAGGSFPWQKIWSLECLNKVKIFAWRLAHNSLRLRRKIESGRIELDTR
jgi:hypothetical protein